jgi:hypothetical protein
LDAEQSPERAFHDFVNKFAQLCDTERGGNTITALTVIQYPDHIQYRFTSNQRHREELDRTQIFIASILNALGKAERGDLLSITSNILRKSVSFTRPRVQYYVNALKRQVTSCISGCQTENADECKCNDINLISDILPLSSARLVLRELQSLQEKLLFSNVAGLKDDDCECFDSIFMFHAEWSISFSALRKLAETY